MMCRQPCLQCFVQIPRKQGTQEKERINVQRCSDITEVQKPDKAQLAEKKGGTRQKRLV